MKIFGYKLTKHSSGNMYIHADEAEDFPDYIAINPEKMYSSACHLYTDDFGVQYIGFEVSLGMDEKTMRDLIKGKKLKMYTV